MSYAVDLSQFEADADKVNNGVWKNIGIGNIQILFRSPHSPKFIAVKRRIESEHLDAIRKNRLTPEQQQQIFFDSVIEGGIIDWRNVIYEGQNVPWSVENGKRFLSPIYFRAISDAAFNAFMETDQFLREFEEEGKENLSVVLNGQPGIAKMQIQ